MNKSLFTNIIALAILLSGYGLSNTYLLYAGAFALSGALTNWLAIHMLFEKVPGLYGSGIIPARFEEFKTAIKALMMEQFFTDENIHRFISDNHSNKPAIDFKPVLENVDFSPAFDSLVEVVQNSQFGGMLAMFGGTAALDPLKEPFVEKIQQSIISISESESVKEALANQSMQSNLSSSIKAQIEMIVEQRLNELSPQLVKEIILKMIKEHLGWLVIWGGVFGGVIGLVSAALV